MSLRKGTVLIAGNVVGGTSPTGTISAFGGSTAPDGWLICNGGAVSRTTYSALFAVIGTTYGSGDGSTTFNLPNKNNLSAGNLPDYSQMTSYNFSQNYTASTDMLVWVYSEQNEPGAGAAPTITVYVDSVAVSRIGDYNYNKDSTHILVKKGSVWKANLEVAGYNTNRWVRGCPLTVTPIADLNIYIIKY